MRPPGHTLPKATDNSDMYNRELPSGNFLFFVVCMMSLFRLPCGKLSLSFLAVPAGKDGRVECPCQTVDDFIGIRGKCLWTFSFCSNARSFDCPTMAKPGKKIKVPISCQAQGRGCFPPCTCGWWLIDGLQVPAVMPF